MIVDFSQVDWGLRHIHWVSFATIPLFTGVVGWLINWTGLIMLFNPVLFHGKHIPGMREVASVLPRKAQEIPGWLHGGLGWQGIVPARSAKMGSLAVDKILKLASGREFYAELDPDHIAEVVLARLRPDVPEIVESIMRRERPDVWRDVPAPVKAAIIARVQAQLPDIVTGVFRNIGDHIDLLLDPKLMVIDHFEKHPALVVHVFRDIGQRELNLMVHFGFIFGFLLGIPVAFADHWFHQPWLLPVLGVVVGWVTNLLGISIIFEPAYPKKYGPITMHGLFARRQDAAADVYAKVIADDVITLERIGRYLLDGPSGDRTRRLLTDALRPAVDRAAGPFLPAVKVAVGGRGYRAIRDSVTSDAVERVMEPLQSRELSQQQSDRIRALVAERTRQLPPPDFIELLRAAIREDEWMLYAHGAIMGFLGGCLHLWIFGVGGA